MRSAWIVLGASLVLVATAVLLLVTAGQDTPEEARGDLTYIEGSVPGRQQGSGKLVASVADLTAASVRRDQQALLFEAVVAAPLPNRLKTSTLELRWDIIATEGPRWTLTVTLDREARAALFSDVGYGAGTVDDTFPGELSMNDRGVEVRLDPAEVPDFPEEFEWSVASTLRAFRNEPDSPRVEDRFPDEGTENLDA